MLFEVCKCVEAGQWHIGMNIDWFQIFFLSAFNLNFTLLSLLKILLKPPDMSGFLVNSHGNSIVFCVCVMMASFWFRWQILQLIQFVRKLSCHWWVFGSFFKFQFEVYVRVLRWKCSSARAPLWSDSSIVSRVTFESLALVRRKIKGAGIKLWE